MVWAFKSVSFVGMESLPQVSLKVVAVAKMIWYKTIAAIITNKLPMPWAV